MRFHSVLLFCVFLFYCVTGFAGEKYVCNHGDAKRVISVLYKNAEEHLPCEVQYDKGEGVQTLWTAQSEAGYCENKAREFVEKQESWGWSCEKVEHAAKADDLVSDLY